MAKQRHANTMPLDSYAMNQTRVRGLRRWRSAKSIKFEYLGIVLACLSLASEAHIFQVSPYCLRHGVPLAAYNQGQSGKKSSTMHQGNLATPKVLQHVSMLL